MTSRTYKIEKKKILGQGAFGVVYEGYKIRHKKDKVAIKVIDLTKYRTSKRQDPTEEISEEIDILERISKNCDGLLCLKDSFRVGDEYWIVTELLDPKVYEELFDFMAMNNSYKTLTNEQKRDILLNMAKSLKELHSEGIAHRDLKLENYMINKNDYTTKLIDYGFACAAVNIPQLKNNRCQDDSRVLGTPGYVAPETLKGKNLNKVNRLAADIFGLGSAFFTFLESYPLFGVVNTTDVQEIIRLNAANQRNSMRKGEQKDLFENLIMQMTQTTPNKRPTISKVIKTLEAMNV